MSHKAKDTQQKKSPAPHQNFPLQGGKPQQKAEPAAAAGKSGHDGHKASKGSR